MPITLKLLLGVAFFALAIWIGISVLRALATSQEERSAQVRDVEAEDVRYRCLACGLEIRMTKTPEENARPPRHCMEEMELVGEA